MKDLDQKISGYSEELFLDLGLTRASEDEKADMYARIQDHMHEFIMKNLVHVFSTDDIEQINMSLEQEDYETLAHILDTKPVFKQSLEVRLDEEFASLKNIITEEQKNNQTGNQYL